MSSTPKPPFKYSYKLEDYGVTRETHARLWISWLKENYPKTTAFELTKIKVNLKQTRVEVPVYDIQWFIERELKDHPEVALYVFEHCIHSGYLLDREAWRQGKYLFVEFTGKTSKHYIDFDNFK